MSTGAKVAVQHSNIFSDSGMMKILFVAIAAALTWKRLCRLHHLSARPMSDRPGIPAVGGKSAERLLLALQAMHAADTNYRDNREL